MVVDSQFRLRYTSQYLHLSMARRFHDASQAFLY